MFGGPNYQEGKKRRGRGIWGEGLRWMINWRAVCRGGSKGAFVGACLAGSWAALLHTAGTWSAGALWGWLQVEPRRERKDGSVVGVEVATYSEFSEEKYIPKAVGANLGRQKRGLKAAWLATHVAFEVMVFTQFPEGGRGYGKSPSVYNRSVL